jgi:hypothetical protein
MIISKGPWFLSGSVKKKLILQPTSPKCVLALQPELILTFPFQDLPTHSASAKYISGSQQALLQ